MSFKKETALLSQFLNKPFILFKIKKNRFVAALAMSGFVWMFLALFGVFELDYFSFFNRLFYTFIYALFCLLSLLLNFFILQDKLLTKYTTGTVLLWSLWLIFCIGLSTFLLTTLVFRWEEFSTYNLLKNQFYALSLGLIIIPVILIINQNYFLKYSLDKTFHYYKSENSYPENLMKSGTVTIPSQYKNDSLQVEMADLLYIESADNYLVIHLKNKNKLSEKYVRNTLSYIENCKLHPNLVRCHRGFIVNKGNIKSIRRKKGNNLIIFEGFNAEVPISRKYKKRFCQ